MEELPPKEPNVFVLRSLQFASISSIFYSLYSTLFVIDGSAKDFEAISWLYWIAMGIDLWVPFGLFFLYLGYLIYKKSRGWGLLWLILGGGQALGAILAPLLFAFGGGLNTVVITATYYARKIYEVRHATNRVVRSFVTVAIATPLALIGAVILDNIFSSNGQYLAVLADTTSHLTQTYHVSGHITINVFPLIGYCFMLFATLIDMQMHNLKKIALMNFRVLVRNQTRSGFENSLPPQIES
jgi:hypothetical protein